MNPSQNRDSFFSSAEFMSAKVRFEAELPKEHEKEDRIDFRQVERLYPQILRALGREFEDRCGYCGRRTGATSRGCVEHFYPKSKFPERALDPSNLVLSCQVCNVSKAGQFPVDASGQPLLLNPRTDNFSEHLKQLDDGTLQGITPRGAATISALRLNRPGLVDERRREHNYEVMVAARPELRAALLDDNSHARFLTSVASVMSLNAIKDLPAIHDQPLRLMLYANIIACLEAYLGDALIAAAKNNRQTLRKFVENFDEFQKAKFTRAEVFAEYDKVDQTAIEALANVLYHNLPRAKEIYRYTLGVEFPRDMGSLSRAIEIRHDIVHRNGKDKSGIAHALSSSDVEFIADKVTQFVGEIQKQVDEVRRQASTGID